MRKSTCFCLLLALVLGLFAPCAAQTIENCDQLRDRISRMEKIDLNSASPSLRQIYREALLKLYLQLRQCNQQELVVVTEMRDAVGGTSAAPPIENKFQSLTKEKADLDSKTVALETVLNIPGQSPDTGGSQPVVTDEAPADPPTNEAVARTTVSSPAASTPLQGTFPCVPASEYADAPPLLTDIVTRDATDISRGENNGAIASVAKMILYSTLDSASPTSSKLLRDLEPYQYLSETARTDKQLGASPTSEGSVSAIEKPGFARLLGFAIEHGAINKKNDGTNLTLSTSLYSLYTINRGDTAETYSKAGILNRVGVFATFAVTDTTSDLANARRNNLSEWSLKARLFGDRSTRSSKFQKFWRGKIEPLIDARLVALGKPLEDLTTNNPAYRGLRIQAGNCLRDAVRNRRQDADYKAATTEAERVTMLTAAMLGVLRTNVYDRIKSGQFILADDIINKIETQYVPNLKATLENLKGAGGLVEKQLQDLNTGPLGTFAYTNHRIPSGSDYSEGKFLFEQDKSFFRPLKLTGNFGLSFYNRPDPTLKQEKLRDISAALSFEGTSKSPFTEAENRSKITYSFVGRYERLFENRRMAQRKPDIGTFQFVMEIPFFRGLSLPLSASYANTEEEKKKHFRFNFGMRLDTDKLFELLKAGASRDQ